MDNGEAAGSEADHAADVLRGGPFGAVFRDGAGIVAFCQPLALIVADEAVVVVGGGGQGEEGWKITCRGEVERSSPRMTWVMP